MFHLKWGHDIILNNLIPLVIKHLWLIVLISNCQIWVDLVLNDGGHTWMLFSPLSIRVAARYRAESYHPTLLSAVSLYSQSVSCLDAIIYQANQVNRRRNDQCVNAHGLADAAQTNWQRLERKRESRQRERGGGASFSEVRSDPERCLLASSLH